MLRSGVEAQMSAFRCVRPELLLLCGNSSGAPYTPQVGGSCPPPAGVCLYPPLTYTAARSRLHRVMRKVCMTDLELTAPLEADPAPSKLVIGAALKSRMPAGRGSMRCFPSAAWRASSRTRSRPSCVGPLRSGLWSCLLTSSSLTMGEPLCLPSHSFWLAEDLCISVTGREGCRRHAQRPGLPATAESGVWPSWRCLRQEIVSQAI